MEKTMNSENANARKTVIVTGGSQGIGAGLVTTFLDRGYRVVANPYARCEPVYVIRPIFQKYQQVERVHAIRQTSIG
jgi:NAD(P)-dependent dehydrogenase (short-subunit alcohol dehydrogenase family)